MKKRIISLLLVFCMVFSLVPTTAFAANGQAGTAVELTNPFKDVKETDWFYDAVQYARINGFFSGTSKTTFEPNGTMTRGMFVTVLGRMAGVDTEAYKGQSAFSDVPATKYYAPYVAWAAKHGITSGTGDGKFSPDALINRQQMATLFVNYFETFDIEYGTEAKNKTAPADLESASEWAKEPILKLWNRGLLVGDGTNFNPYGNATRAQAATLATRMDEVVETWYKEPSVASDRVKIDTATGEAVTPDTPATPATPSKPSGGSSGGSSGGGNSSTTTYYEVTFAMGSGQSADGVTMPGTDGKATYPKDTKISLLPTPFKDNGLFLGWYYDAAMENAVGSNDVLTRNITLYAKMGEVSAVSEQETPNYISVIVPTADVEDYVFDIIGYEDGCVEYFTHVSNLNADMSEAYERNGTAISADYAPGQTYSIKLKDDSEAVFQTRTEKNGQTVTTVHPTTVRVLNIITEKGEVQNLTLDNDMKYIHFSRVSNLTGTAMDGLFSIAVAEDGGSITQNKNVGSFTYNPVGTDVRLAVGDMVAIYDGTRPDLRTHETQNESVAYVEITEISGTTYTYKTAESEEVLFKPDVLPVISQVADSALMTMDGETPTYHVEVLQADMQFTDDKYAEMGLDSQTTVDVGDFIAFYSGELSEENGDDAISMGYGCITGIATGENDDGEPTYIITYTDAEDTDVFNAMDLYGSRNENIVLTEEEVAELEAAMLEQAVESGFVEDAAEYLIALAVETDGFQELSDDMDMDLSSYSVTFADGTPVGPEDMDLMGVKGQITESSITPKILLGTLNHFEGGTGVRAELVMTFKVEFGSGDNKVVIELQAIFEQEVMLTVNVSGGAVWKWKWIFPYIADYTMNANLDVGTYTGVGITATARTQGKEEDPPGFDWGMTTGNKAGDKIIEIGKQVKDLMDQKNEFMDKFTVPTVGLDGEEAESSGTLTNGGLAEKYAAMIENAEESWVEILRIQIFSSEGHVDPLHILCYGIGADFVVSANLYVTIGMTFEYGVAKRYNFSMSLFGKKATSETIDLEEEHYQFDFYVMGTMGIRAGIELEVAVGLFSLSLDSIGVCAEVGAYAQMWGYFYYSLGWSKSGGKETTCAGAMLIDIGVYLSISFKAQIFSSDKLTYQPTLYENEWPILTIGEQENVYDFTIEEDDESLNMAVVAARTFTLPSSLFDMNYMDMKSGELFGSGADEEDAEDHPAASYDDEEESHFTITLSNPKFTYEPDGNVVTVAPGGSLEEECEINIRWNHGTLAFSAQAVERTVNIKWTDPEGSRYIAFDSRGGSAVNMILGGEGADVTPPAKDPTKLGYHFGGWYQDVNCTQAFVFPAKMPDYETLTGEKGITVYAKWLPNTDTKYTVKHYQEQLNGTYVLVDTDTNTTGTTDALTNAQAKTPAVNNISDKYYGFTVKPFDQKTIAPDGSTLVEIYYTRNTYVVNFTYGDLAEDNGKLTYRAKLGAALYPPTMALGGYVFKGFKNLPLNDEGMLIVTGNAEYDADWDPAENTPYRVEHYVKRLNGEGYLLAADEKAVQTLAGKTNGEIKVAEIPLLNDAGLKYVKATVNGAEISSSNKATIAADGSTVVKLYYDRNSYNLILMDGETEIRKSSLMYGSLLQKPVAEKDGYELEEWYTEPAWTNLFSFANAFMGAKDLILYAKWVPSTNTKYTVEHWQQNLLDDEYTRRTFEEKRGTTGQLTAAEAKNYSADGFQPAKEFAQATIAADGKTVVKIYYDRKTYDVSFETNGGSPMDALTGIRHGAKIAEPAEDPTKEGYTFDGWYKDSVLQNAWTFSVDTVTGPVTLYAKWVPGTSTKYTVEHYQQNLTGKDYTLADTVESSGTTGEKTTAEAKVYDGFTAQSFQQETIAADGSTVVQIYYNRKTYNVTFQTNGGSTVNALTDIRHGAKIAEPTEPAKQGYDFGGWYKDSGLQTAWSFSEDLVTGPVTLYAKWNGAGGIKYLVKHYQQNVTGEDYTLDDTVESSGTTGQLTAAESKTYEGFTAQSFQQATIAADGSTVVEIYYDRKTYDVSFETNGGSAMNALTGIRHGAKIAEPTEPAKQGYNFDGWYKDSGLQTAWTFSEDLVTAPVTLYAKWEAAGNTKYTVEHHQQNVTGSDYTMVESADRYGTTGEETEAETKSYEGFTVKTFAQKTIAADGSTVVAIYYDRNTHDVTFVLGNGEDDIVRENVRYGAAVTKPADPNWTGHTFTGWNTTVATTMPDSDLTYTAQWKTHSYTVVFNKNDSKLTGVTVSGSMDDQTFAYGEKKALSDYGYTLSDYSGYTFLGWSTDPNATEATFLNGAMVSDLTEVDGDTVTLYAVWKRGAGVTYTVNHYQQTVDGTDYELKNTQTIDGFVGEKTKAEAATDEGFNAKAFENVELTGTGSVIIDIYYDRNVHTLTVQLGNGETDIVRENVRFGETITLPENPTYAGHIFRGWNIPVETTMPDRDLTYVAQWDAKMSTITFVTLDDTIQIAPITQGVGTAITAPADPERVGYTFKGWDPALPAVMPEEGMTVTAMWEAQQYTITFNGNGGLFGRDPTHTITLDYGAEVDGDYAPSRTGYTFLGWDAEIPATMPAENLTFNAKWELTELTLTFDANGGVLAEGGMTSKTVYYGHAYGELPPDPSREGYRFLGWRVQSNQTPVTSDALVTSDKAFTVEAYWEAIQYNLTYEENGGTEVADSVFTYAQEVKAPSDPTREGYTFAGWYSDPTFTEESKFFTYKRSGTSYYYEPMNYAEDVRLYAKWTAEEYTINYNLGDSYGIKATNPNNPATYTAGEDFSFQPAIRPGWTFKGWYDASTNGNLVESTTGRTGNLDLYARWQEKTYYVNYYAVIDGDITPMLQGQTMRGDNLPKYNYPVEAFLEVPEAREYNFIEWYTDAACTEKFDFSTYMTVDRLDGATFNLYSPGVSAKVTTAEELAAVVEMATMTPGYVTALLGADISDAQVTLDGSNVRVRIMNLPDAEHALTGSSQILTENKANLIMENVLISGATRAAVKVGSNGIVTMINCTVEDAVIAENSNYEYSVLMNQRGTLNLEGCTLNNNGGLMGGTLYSATNSTTATTLTNCVLTNNRSIDPGNTAVDADAIYVADGSVILKKCLVSGHKTEIENAQSLATIYVASGDTLIVDSCSLIGNHAPAVYGASNAMLYINNSTFSRNTGLQGSSVYSNQANLYLMNSTIVGNLSTVGAVSVNAKGGSFHMYNTVLLHNYHGNGVASANLYVECAANQTEYSIDVESSLCNTFTCDPTANKTALSAFIPTTSVNDTAEKENYVPNGYDSEKTGPVLREVDGLYVIDPYWEENTGALVYFAYNEVGKVTTAPSMTGTSNAVTVYQDGNARGENPTCGAIG